MKASEYFRQALAILGPNGEYWIKGKYSDTINGHTCFCSAGALHSVQQDEYGPTPVEILNAAAKYALERVGGLHNIVSFNDEDDTEFSDVKRFFELAIQRAEELEAHA